MAFFAPFERTHRPPPLYRSPDRCARHRSRPSSRAQLHGGRSRTFETTVYQHANFIYPPLSIDYPGIYGCESTCVRQVQ